MKLHHPGRGAPSVDDTVEILAHFAAQRALGRSISDIAAAGLTFVGQRAMPDGSRATVVLRRLKGATLERRYRQKLAEVTRLTTNGGAMPAVTIMRYVGIPQPREPLSVPKPAEVRRGRRKKNRVR